MPPPNISQISAVLLARDAAATIELTLSSLAGFADVVLYDNGSTDATLAVAARFPNVRVVEGPFDGFGPARNTAAGHARNPWILPVDADEWLDADLLSALAALNPTAGNVIYAFWRRNIFLGKRLRSRLGREWIKRLYHRDHIRFDGRVHERLVALDGKAIEIRPLAGTLWHDPYRDVGHLFHKRWVYAQPELRGDLGFSHPLMATLRAAWRFLRCYVFYGGFIDGWRGYVLSRAEAYGVFLKYCWNYAQRTRNAGH